MAFVWKENFYILGSKLSVGAFDQGYFGKDAEPTTALDVFGDTRFRGNVMLTDSRLNYGGGTSQTGGNGAVVFGAYNKAMGYGSISQGYQSETYGNNSIAVGRSLSASSDSQATFGQFNCSNVSNVLLVVGDGRDVANRSDALRVYNSGLVYANSLSTDGGIAINSPSYLGPLLESRAGGTRRGISTDANLTYVYGPCVQLGTTSFGNNVIQPHLTISNVGTEIDSDCVFYGNVSIIGQTFSTITKTYTTVASSVEVSDPIITVGHGYTANTVYDIGLVGERPSANTGVIWDESRGEWAFIHTGESSESMEYVNFSYANLHINNLNAQKLITNGPTTQNGDLTLLGSASMNSIYISNTTVLGGTTQCQSSLTVNGPSVLNTLFVANQAIFNNALLPTEPDSWPIGQVNNRFSRAYLDTIDVYDALNLPGPVQDTYPARIGAFGEANIYLYTTSAAYLDTVGIYFDKGQSQLPYGKSAIVQEYDHWALRTQGVNRLTANTVTGNLKVTNELVIADNLTSYGAQVWLVNNVWTQGAFQGNTALWSNTTVYGGNLMPRYPNQVSVGSLTQRFANTFLNTLDVYQPGGGLGSTLNVGSGDNTNVYIFSANNCLLTFDNVNSGKSSLYQDRSTFNILGVGGTNILQANVLTANTVLSGDQQVLGNSVVSGQTGTYINALRVLGPVLGNTAVFANGVVFNSTILPGTSNVVNIGNAQYRYNTAFLDNADLYGSLRVGSAGATNVYIYSDTNAPVSLTLDQGNRCTLQQNSNSAVFAVNNAPRLTVDNLTGNLFVSNDAVIGSNVIVQGPTVTMNNLTVAGNVVGNAAFWANASVHAGPILAATANTVVLGNTSCRLQQASLQRIDLYDQTAIKAGSASNTNVFIFSDSLSSNASTGINFDQGGVMKSSMQQNVSSWSLSTQNQPRMVANLQTGNVSFSNDVQVGGNVQAYGQSSTFNNDLRVLGHFAGNNAFWSNTTVVDGSILTFTPNVWSIAAPNNRFAAAFLNHANLYNQSGAAQRIGSSQTANLCIFTDGPNVGQTATLMFDKAGVGRSGMGQDGRQWFLTNNGNTVLTANNVNGNLLAASELVVGSNLAVYGQTVSILSDLQVLNRVTANTFFVANTATFASNILVDAGGKQQVNLGNVQSRFSNLFSTGIDVYGPAVIGGPGSAVLSVASSDVSQVAAVVLSQGTVSNSSLQQSFGGLTLSTQNVPRMLIANTGNINILTSAVVQGNAAILGQVLTANGNVGLQGQQSRWPLDFNGYTGEKTIGLGVSWLGSNGGTFCYQTTQGHRFYTATSQNLTGNLILSLLPNLNMIPTGHLQPASDLTQDIGAGLTRWRQVVAGNVYTSSDATLNGAVVGNIGIAGAVGLASNAQPSNAYTIVQHASGNTWVNSGSNAAVKLCTGNTVGAVFTTGRLRIGDNATPTRTLEVVQDAAVGGTLFASQSSGYVSSPVLLTPNSSGWLQIGTLLTAPGSSMKLSLLGQSSLGNSATMGGETVISICTSATNMLSGSWYNTGFQQAINALKTVQLSANTYSLYVSQGSNNVAYTAAARLTNANFSHACLPVADPGAGNAITIIPQQYILNGFSVLGNSVGVLSNAIGGQPWLFNGNSTIYAQYTNVGIGTVTPQANLDVRGSIAFTGQLISNGALLPATQIVAVSNAYVSNAADQGLFASNTGIAYPSSLRLGDSKAPGGVLEIVQANGVMKAGGVNGQASDLTANLTSMALNLTGNTVQGWKFNKLANYNDLSTKSTVATIDGTGSYIQSSDERLKENISDIDQSSLAAFRRLRPRKYTVPGSQRQKYGFVAQEVQSVMPELVHQDEAGYLSIDYGAFIPFLFETLVTPTQLAW